MRFLQFEKDGKRRLGVETSSGGDVIDLGLSDSNLPSDMRSFIEGGQPFLQAAKRSQLLILSSPPCFINFDNFVD